MTKLSKRETLVLTGHLCPTCNVWTELIESGTVYGKDFGLMYRCPKCGAYVGVHRGTINAKGSVADRHLRDLRKLTHHYFDRLWSCGSMKRNEAYKWLSLQMGLPIELTHIGMFSPEQCERAILICSNHKDTHDNSDPNKTDK